jgi:hypothetical protein
MASHSLNFVFGDPDSQFFILYVRRAGREEISLFMEALRAGCVVPATNNACM